MGQDLENVDGISFAMAGVLPGHGVSGKKLVRFGYAQLKAEKDSLLFRTGEQFPFHEFHYWDSTHPGMDLAAQKTVTGREWSRYWLIGSYRLRVPLERAEFSREEAKKWNCTSF